MKTLEKNISDILLDESGVDQISAVLQEWMAQSKVQQKNAVRSRLAIESILEDLCVHFDRKLHISVETVRRFGSASFVIRYQRESYNPLKKDGTDEWLEQLLSSVGLMPVWSYKSGINELVLKLPRNKLRSEIWLISAFISAIFLGLIKPVIPTGITAILSKYVFSSVSTVFMNLLGTFAGIMVFLSVIAGICGVGNVADFSKMGKYLIGRNVLMSFLGAGFCAFLMIPFFSFRISSSTGNSQFEAIWDMLIQIVPKDPITPFLTGNMLQIVFMAVFIGVTVVILDSKAKILRGVIVQANSVILNLINAVCKLLPLYILSSLSMMFWDNGIEIFRSIWKPLVLCALFVTALMVIKLLIVSVRCRANPLKLFKKVFPGFLIGLTTASSTAALGTVLDENEKALGINSQLSNFGFPIEMIISVSTVSGGFISIIYYLAEYEGIQVDVMWFISAWILTTVISFSMPPIAGVGLVYLGVLFAQFNIPVACLGIAGTLTLLTEFFMTPTRIVISQMELVLEGAHWKTLDYDRLRS